MITLWTPELRLHNLDINSLLLPYMFLLEKYEQILRKSYMYIDVSKFVEKQSKALLKSV